MIGKLKDLLRPYKHRLMRRPTELSWYKTLRNWQRHGYDPPEVYDIGVAHGTWELYDIYDRAVFFLCDPDPRATAYMEKIAKHLGADRCHLAEIALADAPGMVEFNVREDMQGSTLFGPAVGPEDGATRKVHVRATRFDTFYPDIKAGSLVKIDVQGAELMVLRGMERALGSIGAILVEVSTIATLDRSPEANAVIQYLYGKGFVLADIVGALRRPLDNQTAQMDLLFLPDDSPLRRHRSW